MREIENLKNEILKQYPRLDKNATFYFRCHPGVSCFNDCCGDVNIFLTPYDIIRLKNKLGMTSTEFLKKYTILPFDQNLKYPVIMLQMGGDEKKKCPFVKEAGCSVYEDRPWACRMYPLGLASPGESSDELEEEFYFLLKEDVCKGFNEDKQWTVGKWLDDQGIDEYNRMGEFFKELTTHKFIRDDEPFPPQKVELFFLGCYDIDRFRSFVFDSSFLDKFEIDKATVEKIKTDDIELLKFAYQWLRFALFGEETMKVRKSVINNKKKELIAKGKLSRDFEGDDKG
ncbi:MAG: YkgJ family cysteine cluster protein [bacterium]